MLLTPALIISVTFVVMLCGCMLAMSVHVLRKVKRLQAQLDKDMSSLRGEITAVGRGAIGLGKRFKLVQDRLQDSERRQEDLENKDVGDIAISHASKLVQMGAGAEELVATCGLSKAEATLLTLMHSRSKTAGRNAA
jgi:hypothetical protein|tara:strand:+ start:233 stop:643 length:411 start_codon:yes stop_codon:yes gene_type:complete